MKRIFLILLNIELCFIPLFLSGQEIDSVPGKIESYLSSAVNAWKFNGVALVARKDGIIFHKAYGWQNYSDKKVSDTSTCYPLLSITKSFTALAIMKLQELKKLSLNDKVNRYLPDFPNGNNISIEQLLDHTSGMHNFTDDIGEEDSAIVNHPVKREFMMKLIAEKPVDFKPGKSFQYNNSGYYLAGLIIEKVTGKSYEQNVRELIFQPLGMDHSGFDYPGLDPSLKATGYQFLNDIRQKIYPYLDSTVSFSAGSIYSTSSDLFKFTKAIADKRIISPDSWKVLLAKRKGGFGLGFRIGSYNGINYIRHSGGYPGFVTEYVYYPEKDVTIILLKNSGNYGEDVWPVAMGLSDIMFGNPYDLWKLRKSIYVPENILKEYEGKYVLGKTTVSFVVRDHQLVLILADGSEIILFAESMQTFFPLIYNTTVHFIRDENGKFTKANVHEHGKDDVYRKKI